MKYSLTNRRCKFATVFALILVFLPAMAPEQTMAQEQTTAQEQPASKKKCRYG